MSIFSNLPNNLIMNIIKMNTEEELREQFKDIYINNCMCELRGLSQYAYYEDYDPSEIAGIEDAFDEKPSYYLRQVYKRRFHDRYYFSVDEPYVPNWLKKEREEDEASFIDSDSDDE